MDGPGRSAVGVVMRDPAGDRYGLVVDQDDDGLDVLWLPGQPERVTIGRGG